MAKSQPHSWHRFAWFDAENTLRRISRRFFFSCKRSERVIGLCWRCSRLIIGYLAEDGPARTATVKGEELAAIVADVTNRFGDGAKAA